MTHKITEQLRTLLKAYAERAAKVRADAKPVVDEGEQRRRACGERLQKLVRPALLRFLTELENAGHDASVQDHTDSVDTASTDRIGTIGMEALTAEWVETKTLSFIEDVLKAN